MRASKQEEVPCLSCPLHIFMHELKREWNVAQIKCIEVDNAKIPAAERFVDCYDTELNDVRFATTSISRQRSMPSMASTGLAVAGDGGDSEPRQRRNSRRPNSMPSMRQSNNLTTSRWTEGCSSCEGRERNMNARWSEVLRTPSPDSRLPPMRRSSFDPPSSLLFQNQPERVGASYISDRGNDRDCLNSSDNYKNGSSENGSMHHHSPSSSTVEEQTNSTQSAAPATTKMSRESGGSKSYFMIPSSRNLPDYNMALSLVQKKYGGGGGAASTFTDADGGGGATTTLQTSRGVRDDKNHGEDAQTQAVAQALDRPRKNGLPDLPIRRDSIDGEFDDHLLNIHTSSLSRVSCLLYS